MRFIGLDLTDPYAKRPRPVDVAVLDVQLRCEFLRIPWSALSDGALSGLELDQVAGGPLSGNVLVIDGPLALATTGRSTRECERARAVECRDLGTRNSSAILRNTRLDAAPETAIESIYIPREPTVMYYNIESATMLEAYPGAAWAALGSQLPKKNCSDGCEARRAILEAADVVLPPCVLTHDALDAALCALIGYWTRATSPRTRPFGLPCTEADGVIREGFIIQPIAEH